ncbi:ubiquitin carboxyl-terminal hydrolase 36-like [Palaemon carinicauda]|uniref:ubiquitin carboxyl-terminal hydrolase 36-like n=1 Tax=Palaemon carinicauda TaxID=392227 RepID=UPI0035B5DF91
MPASSADVIGAALASTYQQKPADTAPSTAFVKKSLIDDQLVASSKQVLLNHVDYERVGTQQSLVLSSLKNKYVNLTACNDTTGNIPNSPSGSMAHAPHKTPGAKEDQLDEPRVVLWPKDRVMLGWRKTLPPGAGMINLGNTCYMNSSLQALFHIPSMANWLMEDLSNHTQRCEANASSASYCSICAMMRTLRSTLDRSANVIKPSLIHHKLKSIGKTLMYGRQEDAHEFIKLLLDHMEKSYLSFRRASKLDHRSKETTPLNQIFGGYIRQQVICPVCRHVSTTFSHFQDLVLDIRSVNSVDEALNLYFKKETLDSYNAYKCERCHKKVPATKRHLIERAPHVLLIQLKRFTFSGGKINKHINIQRTIDISRFVNGQNKNQSSEGSGPYQYRLASMVIHLGGSQHGGHYTAVAEASSGTMFEFDDSSVRSISVQSALMRNPYILFYELIRKPKDPLHIKQVVRQSSEKTLIRQNSDGIFKPIPTSHSASSVVNGYGRTSDNIGEAVSRNGTQTPISKPPLPSHKEREKISFGLKFNSGGSKGENSSKPNKIILNSGTTTLLSTKPSSTSMASSSGKTTTSIKSMSSLVPYHDDSEDSELDESKQGGIVNGVKEKLVQNGTVKSEDVKKDKSEKGTKGLCKQDRVINSNADSKTSSSESGSKCSSSNSSIKSGTSSVPFVPRSLQIVNGASPVNTSSSSSSSSGSKTKGEKGWLVTDNAQHSPSESSSGSAGGTSAFTVVEQPTSSKEKQAIGHEKTDNHGWTITTIRNQRPELEKSHSHDSVLPGPSHKKDEADSASLRSKASVDSTRSDRSTKSVKKSIFSLFTCVSSARSPDSPEEEQPEASHPPDNVALESRTKASEGDPKIKNSDAKTEKNKSASSSSSPSNTKSKKGNVIDSKSKIQTACNGQANLKSDSESDTDMSQSKRFRDHDDEPSSPSKKCRPEEGKNVGNKKVEGDATKNGPCSVSKNGLNCSSKNLNSSDSDKSKNRLNHEVGKSKNGLEEVGRKCKKKKKHKKENGTLSNGVGENSEKSHKELSSSDSSLGGASSGSVSSDSEGDPAAGEHWVEKTKETIGKAKLNPAARVIKWNGTRKMKDLSHAINGDKEGPQENGIETDKNIGMWNGSRPSEVVDELRRAGNFAFGTKVNSWEGGKSITEEEFEKDRKELKKRTLEDLYNEEFDTGKTKKIKLKNSIKPSDNWNVNSGNVFQRVQDVRNSGGTWSNYRNSYGNNNNYGYGHYNKQHKNRDGYWNEKRNWNKNRDHYHQRSKQWKKFDKRDRKFHKKHKEKYRPWDRND